MTKDIYLIVFGFVKNFLQYLELTNGEASGEAHAEICSTARRSVSTVTGEQTELLLLPDVATRELAGRRVGSTAADVVSRHTLPNTDILRARNSISMHLHQDVWWIAWVQVEILQSGSSSLIWCLWGEASCEVSKIQVIHCSWLFPRCHCDGREFTERESCVAVTSSSKSQESFGSTVTGVPSLVEAG